MSEQYLLSIMLFIVCVIPNFVILLSEKWIDLISYKKHRMTSKIGKSFALETVLVIAAYILYSAYIIILVACFYGNGSVLLTSSIIMTLLMSIAIPTILFILEQTGAMNPLEYKPSVFMLISNVFLSLAFDFAYGFIVGWYFLSDLEFEIFGNGEREPFDYIKVAKFLAFTVALVVITIVIKAIIQWIIAKISAKRQQQTITETT